MAISIPVASNVLRTNGFENAVVPAIAIVVGLHFFGLVRAFDSQRFAVVGGAMCLFGVLSLGLPVHLRIDGGLLAVRDSVVGVGCALVLWISVLRVAIPTWRDVR